MSELGGNVSERLTHQLSNTRPIAQLTKIASNHDLGAIITGMTAPRYSGRKPLKSYKCDLLWQNEAVVQKIIFVHF